ncbi:hypothetical protein HK102_011611, partial [Quaeritorhiza haematococci]
MLHYRVSAVIKVKPIAQPIEFDTVLELGSKAFLVRGADRELVYLRDMGDQFARAQPAVAGLLALSAGRCEDPHVERLMQAFALLAARVRKKLDDRFPEISNALEVVHPHYLRPLPSAAVVQFEGAGDPSQASEGRPVPAGTTLPAAVEVEGVRCRFRTAYPVDLWPVTVEGAVLAPDRVVQADKPPGAVGLLKLTLRCRAPGGWESLAGLGSLRFFLDGGEPVASVLHECLLNRVSEVWVVGESDGRPSRRILPKTAVRPVGFGPDEALYPYPGRSFPGYRLLQEFFAFPQKFQFVDVFLNESHEGSHPPLGTRTKLGPTIGLLFWLDGSPRSDVTVRPTNFRLGCTPAVNLFRWVPEPIPLTRLRTEYRVTPSVEHPTGYEVFSVDRVVSSGSYLEEAYEFQPFYAMRHGARE